MLSEITDEKTVRDMTNARSCKLRTVFKYAVRKTLAAWHAWLGRNFEQKT